MTNNSTELHSVGFLCVVLHQVPSTILAATKQLNLEPAAVIDGRPHFSAEQAEKLREHFADKPLRSWTTDPLAHALLKRRGHEIDLVKEGKQQ